MTGKKKRTFFVTPFAGEFCGLLTAIRFFFIFFFLDFFDLKNCLGNEKENV